MNAWRTRPRSLQATLIAALLAVIAAVCAAVTITTAVMLDGFLVHRLDQQVVAAGRRSAAADHHRPDTRTRRRPPPGAPRFLLAPGQSAGTLGARVSGGRVRAAAILDRHGRPRRIGGARTAALTHLAVGAGPVTRDLGSLGEYRVAAARTPDGTVLVTGVPLAPATATVHRVIEIEAIVSALALLVAGAGGTMIVRAALRPLRRVAGTASDVARLRLDSGEVELAVRVPTRDTDPRTEVGQVGTALNQLLGHVEAALAARHASESRIRRFVADASHELRTPLSALRGYAELTRRSPAVPEVRHALRRIESEGIRMTDLVEDLLLLARLDAGRPLARDDVDLSRLTIDAVGDARAAGPRHHWVLELPVQPVRVTGDPHRLHQTVGNLLGNARTHTPAGSTVTVTLRRDAGAVELVVADDGPGIPDSVRGELFERFARADTSRSRSAGDTGGTGLGLAIVAAIVAAHGGTVATVAAATGATFVLRLPQQPETTHRTGTETTQGTARPYDRSAAGAARP